MLFRCVRDYTCWCSGVLEMTFDGCSWMTEMLSGDVQEGLVMSDGVHRCLRMFYKTTSIHI